MVFGFLTTIAICLLAVLVLIDYWVKRKWSLVTKQFDGPKTWPILGNALLFRCSTDDILTTLNSVICKYKQPLRIWLGPELIISSDIPQHVEKILTSSKLANKYEYVYEIIKPYLGNGLVTASEPNHRKHRRIIQPFLNLKFCNDVLYVLQKHINVHLNIIDQYANNNEDDFFNICKYNHKCYVDFVCEVLMGTKINAQKGENQVFIQAAIDMYQLGINKMVKPWLRFDFIYRLTKEYKQDMNALKVFREFGEKVIKESEERRKLQIVNPESPIVPIIDEILGHMEENPDVFSKSDFIDHMLTLYAASEDTLSIISSFSAVCFGIYPEYQSKAYSEIREIIGEQVPDNITIEDLNKLTYLDRCVRDVIRLFPIAPYILRRVNEDFELDSFIIPKGVGFMVPIFNLHRDPKYWQKPNEFYPDHFLDESVKKRPIYCYVPFSAGPRSCIGKILAMGAIKLYLCKLLLEYEIFSYNKKLDDIKLRMDISVRPVNGYNVRIKRRNC